jgi:hypothetical protein
MNSERERGINARTTFLSLIGTIAVRTVTPRFARSFYD